MNLVSASGAFPLLKPLRHLFVIDKIPRVCGGDAFADDVPELPVVFQQARDGVHYQMLSIGTCMAGDLRKLRSCSGVKCSSINSTGLHVRPLPALHYQAERHVLQAGDSVYFDASEAHSYCGQSESICKAIVITVFPRL